MTAAPQTDIYTHERAGFAERLGRLAGRAQQYEPRAGRSAGTSLPDEHAIAACLAMARRGPTDIGPDIAAAIYCQSTAHRGRIVGELTAALAATVRCARKYPHQLPLIAAQSYLLVATMQDPVRPIGVSSRDFEALVSFGASILWQAATDALRRAERAYFRAA